MYNKYPAKGLSLNRRSFKKKKTYNLVVETNVLTPSKTRNTMRRISAEDAMREPGRERQGQASTTPVGQPKNSSGNPP